MRPALEGFSGIPQEARLVANGLLKVESLEIDGFLELPFLSTKHINPDVFSQHVNYHSQAIIAWTEKKHYISNRYFAFKKFRLRLAKALMLLKSLNPLTKIELIHFNAHLFHDFIWRSLFAKSLSASEKNVALNMNYKISPVPRNMLYLRLNTHKFPVFNTQGYDVFISHLPFPGNVSKGTSLVVRYHDSIPILMPHTIENMAKHNQLFFSTLVSNVKSLAWFSCVSETVRQELIQLFPEVESRSVTIHNMISSCYFFENSSPDRVPHIIRDHLTEFDVKSGLSLIPSFSSNETKEHFYNQALSPKKINYLLIVSTVEPRKNHLCLIEAWNIIKEEIEPSIKLVVVGNLGWNYEPILKKCKTPIEKGQLFMLSSVAASDLRVLYRNAIATVCPSFAEGFDYSGVESMRCGGITIASDIPVHQEIYQDAALYFDPYSTDSLVAVLKSLLKSKSCAQIQQIRERGNVISSRYLPEHILPQWKFFMEKIRLYASLR